ncbi:MAG: hypothetical protein E7580_09085 [Ruminococcaceae bacterium]|nr:hypothetical protein [Oscillospiraceae bacterium]
MKKIFAILLAVLMLIALVACDDKKDDNDTEDTSTETKNEKDDPTEGVVVYDRETLNSDDDRETEDKKTEDNRTEEKKTDEKKTDEKKPTASNGKKIKEYVEENEEELLEAFESSFASSSGLTCTSSVEVEGNGFIIYVNINELEDLDNDMKKQMQEAYDSAEDYFDLLLDQLQDEVPEIEYFKIVVCEKDGDPIATIEAED